MKIGILLGVIINAVKELVGTSWELRGIALTIPGYTIKKRTQDKHVAAGAERSGFLENLISAAKR